jgi:hypothetical protein
MISPNYTQTDIIFLSGLFEGEGAMWIASEASAYNPHINAHVAVTNNSLELLLYLQDKFGGTVHTKRKIMGENTHITHQWHLAWRDISTLLSAMLPYLITKKEVAKLVIEYRTTVTGKTGKLSQADRDKREELYKKYLHLVELKKSNIIKIKRLPHG